MVLEQVNKSQKYSQNSYTIFIVSILLFVAFLALYSLSKEPPIIYAIICEFSFIALLFSFLFGTYHTLKVNELIESDILQKINRTEGLTAKRVSHYTFDIFEDNRLVGTFSYDQSTPTNSIEIDQDEHVIKYN